jgi:2-oxoisovalerate dehydrogenase E2 component (dihydrolipoyl transacylase)
MPFFIKAFSLALTHYPIMNSTYHVTKPFEYNLIDSHNISIAIDSPKGLVVPNIKDCQKLSILEIQQELLRLRKLGEEGKLGGKDLFDGTITISNIGFIFILLFLLCCIKFLLKRMKKVELIF